MRFRLRFGHRSLPWPLAARRPQRRRADADAGEAAPPPTSAAASTCWPRPPPRIPQTYGRIMAEAAATKNAGAILWKIEKRRAPRLLSVRHRASDRRARHGPCRRPSSRRSSDAKIIALEVSDLSENATASRHRQVGAARHVHRRPPSRQPALQHRVRHRQIDHRPLRHAGRSRRAVQAVDRHHDPVGVRLRARQGAEAARACST